MFNHHQQNGGISPQMMQMQRLIAANRGPRAPNFMSADVSLKYLNCYVGIDFIFSLLSKVRSFLACFRCK
jgi:hypothetical protein